MLASRTAELHGALSDDHGESAFVAEPLTAADLEALAADSREQVRLALAALRGGKSDNPSLFQKGGETPPLQRFFRRGEVSSPASGTDSMRFDVALLL